ncbi:hypothetical protein COO60DRAFT_981508 [Scenedesmus sp. NREL 46B-D3]|nr:hypothetical protein COO60DRAFT_981508 [Scenedesmus sp. NREL 46B-D3]
MSNIIGRTLAGLLLGCFALSAVGALPPKAEILADGLKAVNYWRENHDQYCGWEDGTLMIGVATLQGAQVMRACLSSYCALVRSSAGTCAWHWAAASGTQTTRWWPPPTRIVPQQRTEKCQLDPAHHRQP